MVNLLIQLVVTGLIVWVLWWGLNALKLPQPFDKVGRVLIVLAAVVYLILILQKVGGLGNINI